MKRIFTIFLSAICLSICYVANSQDKIYVQDSIYLVPSPHTARWSYIETNHTGKHVATIYNSVESIEGDGVNGKLKLCVEEVRVASPKDTIKSFNFYRFKDGEFIIDVCAGLEDNMFEGKLDSTVRNTIKEKYAGLSKEKEKKIIDIIVYI